MIGVIIGCIGILITIILGTSVEDRKKWTFWTIGKQKSVWAHIVTKFTRKSKMKYSVIGIAGLYCKDWGWVEIDESYKLPWWKKWLELTPNNIRLTFTPYQPITYLNSTIEILVFGRWHNFRQSGTTYNTHGTLSICGNAIRQ